MCALLFSFVFKQVSNQFTKMSKQHRNNRPTSLNFRPSAIMECRPTSADRSLIILQLPLYLFIIALWFPRCYTLEPAPEVNHWTTPVRQTNRQNTRRVSTQIMASLSFLFSVLCLDYESFFFDRISFFLKRLNIKYVVGLLSLPEETTHNVEIVIHFSNQNGFFFLSLPVPPVRPKKS